MAEGLIVAQDGVVERGQLIAEGVAPHVIDYRVRTRRLIALYPGVYAVGHAQLTRKGRWIAAVLACGPRAVLSHRSAAALHDIRGTQRGLIDVTTTDRGRKGHPGIELHRTQEFNSGDTTIVDGVPVTTVARTLLDLAALLTPTQLRRTFEQAQRIGILDYGALERLIERCPGRRGMKALRALVVTDHTTAARARSDLEARFLDFVRERGLPMPAVNTNVAGYDVDAHWPGTRLVVELDSWRHHSGRGEFDSDREKWLRLKAEGFEVISVTDPMLRGGGSLLAAAIARGARSPRSG